jgi:hypothetical protein
VFQAVVVAYGRDFNPGLSRSLYNEGAFLNFNGFMIYGYLNHRFGIIG